MKILICIAFYLIPLIVCLAINAIVNWEDAETIGDLLFPSKSVVDNNISPVYVYYVPAFNWGTLICYILLFIALGISYALKKIGFIDLLRKFLNIKIKN